MKKMEDGKGIIVRFVIGRRFSFLLLDLLRVGGGIQLEPFLMKYILFCSGNHGDNLDNDIDHENRLTNDFLILVCLTKLWILFDSYAYKLSTLL